MSTRPIAVLASLLALVAGCNSTSWNFLDKGDRGLVKPANPGAAPSVASLVAYLNENASRVRSLRVNEMNVTAKMGIQQFDLRGLMLAEKPRNFRMKAKVLGSDIVDLGSNNDEFWYWMAKNQPPYQFYCPYKDMQGAFIPIPFQPEWIMETMGLGPYGPAERYTLETNADSVRLVEKGTSPEGKAVRKVIVMRRSEVRAPTPQVMAYLLLDDATGQEICSAHISQTQVDRATGAILPHRVELRWPAQNASLRLVLNGVTINAALPQTAFVRTRVAGVESYNLARRQLDGAVQPAQGFRPRR